MKSVMRLLLAVSALGLGLLVAAPPPWWTTQGVLTPATPANDYAAANLGQVKSLAAKAAAEFNQRFAANGGAGPAITSLIAAWRQPPAPGAVRNDYAAVNQGQLKAVARLFYDRLAEFGYQGPPLASGAKYPWPATTIAANDFAAANLGQVKYLFSFDPSLVHPAPAGNSLPDAWQLQYFGHTGVDPASDPGGVGRTLLESSRQGLSPWPAPTVPSGLRAWYRADAGIVMDANNKVSQWTDVSGSGFHVVQTGATQQPVFMDNPTDLQPTVSFDGTTVLATPGLVDVLMGSSDLTVIAIINPAATQTKANSTVVDMSAGSAVESWRLAQQHSSANLYALSWSRDAAQSGLDSSPAIQALGEQVQMLGTVKAGTNSSSYLNGVTVGTTAVAGPLWASRQHLVIGNQNAPSAGFQGRIAEILVYNRALSGTERQRVEASLGARYGIQASGPGIDPNNWLPTSWEMQYFGHLGVDPNDDPDGDGLTNMQEYLLGTDPTDYYNGHEPLITVLSGEGSLTGEFVVSVHKPDGTPYRNAPVSFDVPANAASLAGNPDSTITHQTLKLRTDANGMARVYLRPAEAGP